MLKGIWIVGHSRQFCRCGHQEDNSVLLAMSIPESLISPKISGEYTASSLPPLPAFQGFLVPQQAPRRLRRSHITRRNRMIRRSNPCAEVRTRPVRFTSSHYITVSPFGFFRRVYFMESISMASGAALVLHVDFAGIIQCREMAAVHKLTRESCTEPLLCEQEIFLYDLYWLT